MDALEHLYELTILISVGLAFFHIYKNNEWNNFILFQPLVTLVIFIIDYYGGYLGNKGINNLWLYNWNTLLEKNLYIFILSRILFNSKVKLFLNYSLVIYSFLTIVDIFFYEGRDGFISISYCIGSLIVIIACIYYFIEIFRYPKNDFILKQTNFWIVTALLFFYVCYFPIFALNNIYNTKVAENIWPIIVNIGFINNIIFYTLLSIAFLCQLKTKKS